MGVKLNHTIVSATDRDATARFLSEILGLPEPGTAGRFRVLSMANGVSLDVTTAAEVHPQHYAFEVDDDEFDQIFDRIVGRGLTYWADPGGQRVGEINHRDGGRGLYWEGPDGHSLEILTVPNDGGSKASG